MTSTRLYFQFQWSLIRTCNHHKILRNWLAFTALKMKRGLLESPEFQYVVAAACALSARLATFKAL